MPRLRFESSEIEAREGQTVLEALEQGGLQPASSCRAGACRACLLCCREGAPARASQEGLSESLREQGYFLACQCPVEGDMDLAVGALTPRFAEAELLGRRVLSGRMVSLRFRAPEGMDFRAGQFVNLRGRGGIIRSYSIARPPDGEGTLEVQVQRIAGGALSPWLCDELSPGHSVELQGPFGDCCYRPDHPDESLLLIGTGSGLAPLLGIVRTALAAGHRAPIHLYHGSAHEEGLYLVERLKELDGQHPSFHYHPCTSRQSRSWTAAERASSLALRTHPELADWRVYLCGHAAMVRSTKKLAYLQGASLSRIHCDAFESAARAKGQAPA